jgi:cell fate regulator YaaT (PSP1 superfamily)
MNVAEVQFVPWDRAYYFKYDDLDIKQNDKVVVKTSLGIEIGKVIGFKDIDEKSFLQEDSDDDSGNKGENNSKIKSIIRRATVSDLEKRPTLKEKKEAMDYVGQAKRRYDLPMKFIDVYHSFDGSRLTFAFIADGRVDFREMVKDLTRHFGKTIRLQQIGIRDEARVTGDLGHCGRGLCCRGHLKNLDSITSDMADCQQCSHRGSDRISGICGRLMCCLAYEQKGYEELSKNMPPIGAKVNVDGKRGVVVGHHILKQTVDVEFSPGSSDRTVMEIDLNRNKK